MSSFARRGWSVLAILLPLPALSAQSGVVLQQHTTFNVAKITSGDLTQTVSILGADRARTVTTGKTKVLIISSDAASTEIVRLDRDSVYRLNDKKKEYTARSLADLRAELVKQQQNAAKQAPEAPDDQDVRYTVTLDQARATGEKQTINGFATEQTLIKLTVHAENTKTGEKGIVMYATADVWVDRGQNEAAKASLAFHMAQQQALGIEPAMAGNPYAKWLTNVNTEMGRLSGYPIRATITFEVPRDTAAAARKDDRPPTSVSGAVIGAMFGSKKKAPEPATPNGGVVVFTSMTEVTSVSLTAPAAAEFDVPAGYTRKNQP